MKSPWARAHARLPLGIFVLATLVLLAPALRPDRVLLAANLPFALDPLWQPLAPAGALDRVNLVLSDQFYQYHAWNVALRHALAQGEIPWWHGATNGGQPLLANGQVGLFDAFNLISLLFPLTASYVVGALLRLWVAGAFTWLYARTIGLSPHAALLAMLTFALSGPLVSWLGATPSHIFVWFPALLWTGEKLLATRTVPWALAAASVLALLLFSSQPEIALQVALVWGLYLIARAAWCEGGLLRAVRRHAAWWLSVALVGLALAAVEVLPFIENLWHSAVLAQRTTAPDASMGEWLRRALFSWQLWPTLVTTLLPHFLGREVDESYWYPAGNSIENNAYAGVLPLLLALLALWHTWRNKAAGEANPARQWVWLWGILGLGTLALAVGLPLVQALNDLPPLSLVEASRFRALYVFAVAILAGFGLDALLAQPKLGRALTWLLASAALANVLLIAVAFAGFSYFADDLTASGRRFMEANVGSPSLDRPLTELYTLVELRQQAKLAMLRPANAVMYLPLLVGGATMLILWLLHARRTMQPGQHRWLAPALIAIGAVDLLWAGAGINVAVPSAWLAVTPPAITYLQDQPGAFRVVGTQLTLNPNASMLTQLEDVRGYDPLTTSRYQALLAGLEGFAPSGYHNYFRHVDDPRLDLFNATFALSRTPPLDDRWQAVFADPGGVTVYRSHSALPRAYLIYDATVVENAAQSLTHTLDPSFDPRARVILEQLPNITTPTIASSAPPPNPDDAQVTISQRRANSLYLEVDSPAPAILVMLDSYAPGWHAAVDNTPVPIYPANHAFRAIFVGAGQHSVSFTYAPRSRTVGGAISAGAALVALAMLMWVGNTRTISPPKISSRQRP